MPATTYLMKRELLEAKANAELNELITDVRQATGDDWRVQEQVCWEWKNFRRYHSFLYSVYVGLSNTGEFQIINFSIQDAKGSINHFVKIDLMMAYLMGILHGASSKEMVK